METRLPTYQEMRDLAAFLPRLYAEGFQPVMQWNGGVQEQDGMTQMPYPDYNPLVEEFYRHIANDGWLDYRYNPDEAARMLKDDALVISASLPQIQTMLTFCVRGERFSDGHWAEMIEKGYIRKLLERIDVLSTDEHNQPDQAS